MNKVHLKIRRRDDPNGLSYWEEFYVPYDPGMTVIAALISLRDDPVTVDNLPSTPVACEHNCLEEMCGSCSMVINGKVRQACSTLVDDLNQPIVIEPVGKFPVVRDLIVERDSMSDALAEAKVWVEIDGLSDGEPSAAVTPEQQQKVFALSSCIMCGCCIEACPQVNDRSPFVGAFLMNYVALFNIIRPLSPLAGWRLDTLKGPGGIAGCSNAQTCGIACPKDIPLIETIARLQWDVTKHSVLKFFSGS